MTAHLLLVTIGPVQDFIAQARRTRDLWYGSHLLSELGRAAARALTEGGAKLIFPSLADSELCKCPAPLRPETNSPPQNIANKLLAEVPSGSDPQQLARAARTAVADFWRDEIAAPVKAKCAGLLAPNIDAVWAEQIDSFLEFAASWFLLGDYAQTRRQLEQVIAGRKLLRDFDPWTQRRGNVAKSSLDGARESVLLSDRSASAVAHRYRIAKAEELDAVGLVKRAGGEPEQFVPIVNVALASWFSRASEIASGELDALKAACRTLGVSRVGRPDLPCVSPFAFDASILLPNRWHPVFKEHGFQGDPNVWGREHVGPLFSKLNQPYPYVACLVADGDRMGRAIDALGSAEAHREFSRTLAGFANAARRVVEQRHRGALVYAGGDDVLAFVSLPNALDCADALRTEFERAMADACGTLHSDMRPTLSIGIGIGHVMESMGELLSLGRRAEREAKRDRNSLAVLLDKRSGGTPTWRSQWHTNPVHALKNAASVLSDCVHSRKIHDIANILSRLPKPESANEDGWARVLAFEVKRVLARIDGAAVRPDEVDLSLEPQADFAALHLQVDSWVNRLLIARTFNRADEIELHYQ